MFEITALDSDRPPLHLYVYTSCERPSIYGQVKNTNNHPPRVKNLLLLSKKFCSAFVHAEAAFWLPVYYHSVFFFTAPTGIQPILKRCQGFAIAFFLSVTSLCIPLKHADPRLCRKPGWHTSHTPEVQHEVCTFTKGCFWSWMLSLRLPSFFRTCAPFTVMKRWPVLASDFQLKSVICQLKHGVGPQALNLNKHPFNTFSNSQSTPTVVSTFIQISQEKNVSTL